MSHSESIGVAYPSYLRLYESGELARRVTEAMAQLACCTLCPRRCRVDRLAGEQGYCRAGAVARVASWNRHMWEEPPISGTRGSGTIFFSGCTGACIFCQNYPISQLNHGDDTPVERLASMMLQLQHQGCHNINLVTGTHFVPQVLAALEAAIPQGFRLPLVYNSSGYDAVEALRLLDGIVDIYLPDAKYADDAVARELSGFRGYVEHNRAALAEICRQVGPELVCDAEGIAVRGMIVRHLVLPGGLAGSAEVAQWLAANLSPGLHISVMSQYFPAYKAVGDARLGRKITEEEYEAAIAAFVAAGLEAGWQQDPDDVIRDA
ncbi:MAG TPA: radical SAM protein [Anaerolineae bacterium]|nr:radical SAM protein [Anaerolineae bacterium]HOQ98770.1 radical SAM protein [Anaerolineae bacterium]HPL28987.1 radical SAM protein [Anaerolineae bacterium]